MIELPPLKAARIEAPPHGVDAIRPAFMQDEVAELGMPLKVQPEQVFGLALKPIGCWYGGADGRDGGGLIGAKRHMNPRRGAIFVEGIGEQPERVSVLLDDQTGESKVKPVREPVANLDKILKTAIEATNAPVILTAR